MISAIPGGRDICFFLKRCSAFLKILPSSFYLHKEDPTSPEMSLLMTGNRNIPVAKQKQQKKMSPKVIIVSTNQTSKSPKVSTR